MSIKGTSKELLVGKEEVNLLSLLGTATTLKYSSLKRIDYYFGHNLKCGCIIFVKRTNEEVKFEFPSKSNDLALKAIDFFHENITGPEICEIEPPSTVPEQTVSLSDCKKERGGLSCPKCKSHNIDLWSDEANMKIKHQTSLNLNPLHPLTVFDTKEVKKEKTSAGKISLGLLTGGASLLVTGTKKKAHNEYYCRDCGHRWIGK